jgi:hypothetical protein
MEILVTDNTIVSYASEESSSAAYNRSEGLAVASFWMFKAGLFSSDASDPTKVDAAKLKLLTVDEVGTGMQVKI